MIRAITALLFAACLTLPGWAQASSGSPTQTPAASDQAPAGQSHDAATQPAEKTSASESTQFPLDKFREFSAIQTEGMLPGSDWDGYVYRSGDWMRMQSADQGPTQYYVDNLPKGLSYGLSLGGCAKLPYLYSRTFPFFMSGPGYKYERVPVGEETVDGHHCHVEDITIRNPKFSNPAHFRLYEADDLEGFPIKIVNQQKGIRQWVVHYKDVRLGPQDSTLFTVPRTCQDLAVKNMRAPNSGAKPKNPPSDKPK